MSSLSLFIGLDAGGTKTAVRASCGSDIYEAEGPGINVRRDGTEAATVVLGALIAEARTTFPDAPLGGIAAGLAGAGDDDERTQLYEALRTVLGLGPDAPLFVTHDADLALEAAFGDESGVVVVAGTGSIVYGRTENGDTLRSGGWGGRLGDDGSGTALGRAALRAVASHYDGGPPTRLTARLREVHGVTSTDALLHWVYTDEPPLASLAPLLLQTAAAGDALAAAILDDETDALARLTAQLVKREGGRTERRIALLGGLITEAPYREALLQALAHRLPGWFVAAAEQTPVEGALRLAHRRFQTSESGG